eukprot:jgi/Psemu1/5119/gm1.5119_g
MKNTSAKDHVLCLKQVTLLLHSFPMLWVNDYGCIHHGVTETTAAQSIVEHIQCFVEGNMENKNKRKGNNRNKNKKRQKGNINGMAMVTKAKTKERTHAKSQATIMSGRIVPTTDMEKITVRDFTRLWDCKDLGELSEYVGCKVERHPEAPTTPVDPGNVLEFDKEKEESLSDDKQTKYQFGELSRHMQQANAAYMKALNRVMNYIGATKNK